nr:prepilin-type N-terminal cleavage/methylation domain-containing protein [Conchiformibius kuhniae]
MHKKRRQGGFTLIELMVTIAILAILAMLAYPAYRKFVLMGRMESARETMLRNVQNLERFYARHSTLICGTRNVPECADKSGNQDTIAAVGPVLPPRFTPDIKGNAHTGYYEIDISPVAGAGGNSDTDNYLISAVPNNKVHRGAFSSSELENQEIYLVYFSRSASFVKCTREGMRIATQSAASQQRADCTPL